MVDRFRRGFKSECEEISEETRGELGIELFDPLNASALAQHLDIPVLPFDGLTAFGASAADIGLVQRAASAFTVLRGHYKAVFVNGRHPATRRANSLSHELSHVLLEHQPAVAVIDGMRNWNPQQESEADWLAATLLVPREGALRWLRQGGSVSRGATHFQVSDELFRWRVNQTGISRQLRISA